MKTKFKSKWVYMIALEAEEQEIDRLKHQKSNLMSLKDFVADTVHSLNLDQSVGK
jgi:hypothetical protein